MDWCFIRHMRATVIIVTALLLLVMPVKAQTLKPSHPLDALTPEEIQAAVKLLRDAGHADDNARFPVMELFEPAKAGVLSWKPGQPLVRAARTTIRRGGRTFEAFINLSQNKIIQHREVNGALPAIMQEEWVLAQQLTKADQTWQAAMQKRGLNDFDKIICTPMPAGFRERDDQTKRRLMRVPCFARINQLHPLHGRSIEGVVAVVDPEAKEVVKVIDTGTQVAIGETPKEYQTLPKDEAIKPVVLASPLGTNIKVSGAHLIEWQNWSFHLRADRRAGVILSLIRFNDGDSKRLIAYQMSASEMFVPYMDPDETWAFEASWTRESGVSAI